DTSLSQERPLLRQRFLAWLAIITRRTWQNRARYYDARPDLASRGEGAGGERAGVVYVGGGDEHARWEPPDPQADVAERVDWRLLLESVVSWMATLQTEDEVGARKVAQLLLVATSGVSYEEVARRFDCKVTQVRDAVHSIRLRLRSLFKDAGVLTEYARPSTPSGSPRRVPPSRSQGQRASPQATHATVEATSQVTTAVGRGGKTRPRSERKKGARAVGATMPTLPLQGSKTHLQQEQDEGGVA